MRVLRLIGSLGPDLAFNDGMRDVVAIVLAPRTVTNAEPPGAVSNYQMVNLKLVDVILEAMAASIRRARSRVRARRARSASSGASRGPARPTCSTRSSARPTAAGAGHDGTSGTAAHLSNLHITPIEILELEFPCRIRRFEFVPGSGGEGRWRGGLSMMREYELLEDATRHPPLRQVEIPAERAGRRQARRRRAVRDRRGTPAEKESPPGRYEMKAGDRFFLQTAGGGGFGPAARDPQAVERDIAEGYVTGKV